MSRLFLLTGMLAATSGLLAMPSADKSETSLRTTVDRPVELDRLRQTKSEFNPEQATKADLLATQVFDRPLAVVGEPDKADNIALAHALRAYLRQADPTDQTVLENFVQDHPASPYAPSLLVQIGQAYYNQGRYTRALSAYQAAWRQAKGASDQAAWLLAGTGANTCAS